MVLANRNEKGEFVEAIVKVVDGEKIKAGVWYTLENGEVVEK